MAYPTSFCDIDSAPSADVVRDANPTIQFTKIKSFERYALLRLLTCICLVPLTDLILGLNCLMPVDLKPGDPMPVDPIQAINRYLVKTQKSWIRKDRNVICHPYLPPMLPVSESLSQDEKEWDTLYLSGNSGLTRSAFEECESLLEYPLKNPEGYEDFTEIMQSFSAMNIVTITKLENYKAVLSLILVVVFVSLVVLMLDELYLFDLKSWCSKEGRMMLQISESLSQDAKELFTLSDGDSQPPVAAIEEFKSLFQLFVLMEKYMYTLISPGDLEYFTNIMQFIENIAIFKVEWNYRDSQQSSTLTNEGHMKEPAQTAAVIPHPSTDADHMPDLPKYKMDRLPRGMCIIFNAENFTIKKLRKRLGTQKDVEALLNTFQNRLKFETRVVQDPTKKKYIECLQNIGRMDHSKFDCFVCVILSHGFKGHVSGTDGGTVSIDALTGLFRGDYVPSLVDKPKLFFIQACQGAYPQESVDIQQDDIASLPFKSDILVSHATIPGYASFRNVNQGSLFIISLCKIINTYYKKKVDLLSMLTMVNELMSREAIEGKWMEIGKQIGIHSNILRKQIFFNEGLDE